MIGTDLTRYCALKAAERQFDIERRGDDAQQCANDAHALACKLRADVNAILAPHGVTLAQLERAELA
ncbi:hypothetical protein [Sphingobium chungbukense]|uniref:Uncharacterized protein n=1 Tax=Sphingobium chungbukense TaxID=56193 RepID=A0A0M3AUP3_9SPHN|nr:hypothetical protein [Sphingobium chungbukense]KKW92651.1 hypothetical protein YP76_06865 [Sphingobium chungbukense]